MPKTKEAAIMAAAAYIAANASNGDEHMRHLRNLALKGVRVLQGTPGLGHDATARRTAPLAEQARHPAPVPAIAPRTQVVEPLNGEIKITHPAGGRYAQYHKINERGIEGNPEKIQAIINMQPPRTLRHVQQLTGRLAALSRFISKLGEKALPFYRLLQKTDNFTWTEEAQTVFDDLKRRLSTSPVLVTP
jgi:hypothetical protein